MKTLYTKTVIVKSLSQFATMRKGQWIDLRYMPHLQLSGYNRGQYLGLDSKGLPVINYAGKKLTSNQWQAHFTCNNLIRRVCKQKNTI